MKRKQKKNYYAVHWIGEKNDFIVKTWKECQELTKGHNNMFKGFTNKEQAKEWLQSITEQQEIKHNENVKKQKEMKLIRKNKVTYQFKLDKKLSDSFQEKLKIMNVDVEKVITDFIMEYVGEEE